MSRWCVGLLPAFILRGSHARMFGIYDVSRWCVDLLPALRVVLARAMPRVGLRNIIPVRPNIGVGAPRKASLVRTVKLKLKLS
eukprot:8379214-Pyramimonas_sp.AAC.1